MVAAVVTSAQCQAPVTYRIDSIDPRFNLSRADAEAVVARAAGYWNALRPNVITSASNGEVKMLFLYDERQMKEQVIQEVYALFFKDNFLIKIADFGTFANINIAAIGF